MSVFFLVSCKIPLQSPTSVPVLLFDLRGPGLSAQGSSLRCLHATSRPGLPKPHSEYRELVNREVRDLAHGSRWGLSLASFRVRQPVLFPGLSRQQGQQRCPRPKAGSGFHTPMTHERVSSVYSGLPGPSH